MLIQAGIAQKGSIDNWWSLCEKIHRNEWTSYDQEGEGLEPMEIPFSQPRQDMLTAQVCSVITKQEPYMLAEDSGNTQGEESKERAVHKFWKSAGFEIKLRKASNICTDTNRVFYRVGFERVDDKAYGGLILDVLHPRKVVLFPCTEEGVQGARLVGHRFYRRVKEVLAMKKAKVYFGDPGTTIVGGDSPQEYDLGNDIGSAGVVANASGPDPMDERVELYEFCVKVDYEDSGEKWYLATIAFKTGALLQLQDYPYSRPWYFDASYIISNDDAYWSNVSVARNLAGLQDAMNKYNSGFYNGNMISAFPPIFGPELPEKDYRYSWGDIIPTDTPGQNWNPTTSFRGDPMVKHMQIIDIAGDRTARISANTQGSIQDRSTTATESSIVASADSVGIEEYIGNFASTLADVASFTCELLALHFEQWQGDALTLGVTKLGLLAPCLWEANGKTPGNTPGAKIAACERLVSLAQAFGPASGIDPYELTKVVLQNSNLSGADNIQIPKERLAPPAQPGIGGLPGQPPGVGGPPGVGPGPALPQGPAGPPQQPMPNA